MRAGDPRRLRLAFGFLREGIASDGAAFFDLFLIPAGGLFGRLGRRDAQPFVDLFRRFGQADAFVGRRETHRHKEVLVAREGAAALLQILDFLDLEVAEQPSDVGVAVGRIERQDLGVDLVGALELAALMQLSCPLEEGFELGFGIAELRRVVVAVDHRGFGVPHRGAEADDLLLFRVEPRQQFGALLGRGERVLLRQFRRGDPGQVDLAFRRVEPCGDFLRGEPGDVVDPVSDHLLDPVEAMVHFGAQFFQSRAGRRRNGGRDRRKDHDPGRGRNGRLSRGSEIAFEASPHHAGAVVHREQEVRVGPEGFLAVRELLLLFQFQRDEQQPEIRVGALSVDRERGVVQILRLRPFLLLAVGVGAVEDLRDTLVALLLGLLVVEVVGQGSVDLRDPAVGVRLRLTEALHLADRLAPFDDQRGAGRGVGVAHQTAVQSPRTVVQREQEIAVLREVALVLGKAALLGQLDLGEQLVAVGVRRFGIGFQDLVGVGVCFLPFPLRQRAVGLVQKLLVALAVDRIGEPRRHTAVGIRDLGLGAAPRFGLGNENGGHGSGRGRGFLRGRRGGNGHGDHRGSGRRFGYGRGRRRGGGFGCTDRFRRGGRLLGNIGLMRRDQPFAPQCLLVVGLDLQNIVQGGVGAHPLLGVDGAESRFQPLFGKGRLTGRLFGLRRLFRRAVRRLRGAIRLLAAGVLALLIRHREPSFRRGGAGTVIVGGRSRDGRSRLRFRHRQRRFAAEPELAPAGGAYSAREISVQFDGPAAFRASHLPDFHFGSPCGSISKKSVSKRLRQFYI